MKNIQSTGARKRDETRAPSIANIFVNASGEKSFPSCHSSAKIGKNESIIIRIANKSGHQTSFVESVIIFVFSLRVTFSFPSNLLYAFSVTTIAASTIVHIAIAIHQSDIIFDGIEKIFIHKNVVRIHITKDIAVTKEAPKFQRNKKSIITVIISSEVSMLESVEIAFLIKLVLS